MNDLPNGGKWPATVASTVAGHDGSLPTRPPARKRKPRRGPKPAKPYPEFPLYAHAAGVWAKTINGRDVYFGPWSDPEGALAKYIEQRDYLHAGVQVPTPGATVEQICAEFLAAKAALVAVRELSQHQYNLYHVDCTTIQDVLGKHRLADTLRPADFARLRKAICTRPDKDKDGKPQLRSPVTITNMITRVRTIFKWAYQAAKLMERPPDYGDQFKRPRAAVVRRAMTERRFQRPKDFAAAEVLALLKHATIQLKAMILLGINCGLGNTDCSSLTWSDLDLAKGILDYSRRKTWTPRRAVLWKETVAALKEVRKLRAKMDERRTPPADLADRVFLTLHRLPYVHLSENGRAVDSVRLEFNRAGTLAGLAPARKKGEPRRAPGRGFYSLRHTYRTVADETLDFPAIDLTMGHTPEAAGAGSAPFSVDMASRYRRIGDDRLRAISEHVRQWLYGKRLAKPRKRK